MTKHDIKELSNLYQLYKYYLLFVELTLVLLRERRDIIESPQFTTFPLLMEKCRKRYKSSLTRGL